MLLVAVASFVSGALRETPLDRGSWESYLQSRSPRDYMDCNGTALCGVLTVESGIGDGYYEHKHPAVHGLWPQTSRFGSSACIPPEDSTDPSTVFPCYREGADVGQEHQLKFEQHEWNKHGKCAGARNATDFFQQVCALSAAAVKQMTKARKSGMTETEDFAKNLKATGFPVWDTMLEGQVQLAACGDSQGVWHLAMPDRFDQLCGTGRTIVKSHS